MDIELEYINNTLMGLKTTPEIKKQLRERFSYFAPGYEYSPKYKLGKWDGKIRFFKDDKLHVGLYPKLELFCERREYTLSNPDLIGHVDKISKKELFSYIKSLNVHINGKPLIYDDYRFKCQFDAIKKSIQNYRCILQAPTGIGKSLIIYCLIRYWQDHIKQGDEKCLIVVPVIQLVDQMYADFSLYSEKDKWNPEDNLYKIYQGADRDNIQQDIIISTFQSIYKETPEWFSYYSMVIGDEAHRFTANTLNLIMDNSVNAMYRIGTTGTVGKLKTNKLVLEGQFGKMFNISKTKTLQEKNVLSDLKIHFIKLNYSDEMKQNFKDSRPVKRKGFKQIRKNALEQFQNELDWIVRNKDRNNFILNLANSRKGNTLIMFQFVEKHGKVIYNQIKKNADCKVFYISGEIKKEEREIIRALVEKEEKSIIVASFKTFAEGINIKNLHNLILASPTKSQIRILQSIGRVLRLSDSKQPATLYDIYDELSINNKKNFSYTHAGERLNYYNEEGFNVKNNSVFLK